MITTTPEAAQAWREGRREEVRDWCHGDSTRVAGVALELWLDVVENGFNGYGIEEFDAFLRYIEGGS